jgi:hypothetical protein
MVYILSFWAAASHFAETLLEVLGLAAVVIPGMFLMLYAMDWFFRLIIFAVETFDSFCDYVRRLGADAAV